MRIVRLLDCHGQIQALTQIGEKFERWATKDPLLRGDAVPIDSLKIALEVVPQTIWNPPDKISLSITGRGRIWLYRLP